MRQQLRTVIPDIPFSVNSRCAAMQVVIVPGFEPGLPVVSDDDLNRNASHWLCDDVSENVKNALLRVGMSCAEWIRTHLDDQVQLFNAFGRQTYPGRSNGLSSSRSHVYKEFCVVQDITNDKIIKR